MRAKIRFICEGGSSDRANAPTPFVDDHPVRHPVVLVQDLGLEISGVLRNPADPCTAFGVEFGQVTPRLFERPDALAGAVPPPAPVGAIAVVGILPPRPAAPGTGNSAPSPAGATKGVSATGSARSCSVSSHGGGAQPPPIQTLPPPHPSPHTPPNLPATRPQQQLPQSFPFHDTFSFVVMVSLIMVIC